MARYCCDLLTKLQAQLSDMSYLHVYACKWLVLHRETLQHAQRSVVAHRPESHSHLYTDRRVAIASKTIWPCRWLVSNAFSPSEVEARGPGTMDWVKQGTKSEDGRIEPGWTDLQPNLAQVPSSAAGERAGNMSLEA